MKMLLTGASGFLGRNILERAKNHIEITGTHFTSPIRNTILLNISDKVSIRKILDEFSPEVVIHCASLRNTIAEKNPNLANIVNVDGTQNIVEICKDKRIHFVYISSDSVFDGTEKINNEQTKTNPLGISGRNKVDCESVISKTLDSYCIVRTSLLFGWDQRQNNFAQWIITELTKNNKVRVINDQYVSPSYCKNIADVLIEAATKKINGLYHVAGRESLTRFEFAQKIARIFKLDSNLLIPTEMDSLALDMKRGKNCALNITKILSTFKTPILSLEEALIDMYQNRLC